MKSFPQLSPIGAVALTLPLALALPLTPFAFAQQSTPQATPPSAPSTQLTIYNDDFAVARTIVPLDLHTGVNEVVTTSVTSKLEPDSVVLRDPASRNPIAVLEQNYDAGVVNQQWLLQKYEGQTIDFQTYGMQVIETTTGERKTLPATTVQGHILRAGGNGTEPLIEVNGHLQFQLPGMPIFPANTEGLLLKPTLRWRIDATRAARFSAELDYITHGLKWQSTYNIVLPESSDTTTSEKADLLGWVTIENHSGTEFPQATIELMAGDVAKLPEPGQFAKKRVYAMAQSVIVNAAPEVTQKAFDEFHLYDLHRTVSLRDGETKQVQFLDVPGITVQRTYQYDGNAAVNYYPGFHNEDRNFGSTGNTHVAVREQFKNSKENHLGIPIPAGRLRVYRRDSGSDGKPGNVQFVGENMIPHTPAEQQIEVVTGNAFDLIAARRQTDFHTASHSTDESFEIKLSNQKDKPVTIHCVENMNRGENWKVTAKSTDYTKTDSATIDFPVTVPAKGDAILTYSVHYSW